METYYKKVGKKYVPIGLNNMRNEIPDGIWIVHSGECSRSYIPLFSRIDYEFDKYPNLNVYAEQTETTEIVVHILRDLIDHNELVIYNHSVYDIAEKITKMIYDKIRPKTQ